MFVVCIVGVCHECRYTYPMNSMMLSKLVSYRPLSFFEMPFGPSCAVKHSLRRPTAISLNSLMRWARRPMRLLPKLKRCHGEFKPTMPALLRQGELKLCDCS